MFLQKLMNWGDLFLVQNGKSSTMLMQAKFETARSSLEERWCGWFLGYYYVASWFRDVAV